MKLETPEITEKWTKAKNRNNRTYCWKLKVFGGMALTEEMVSEGKITQNNCKKRKCEVTQMKENGHISAASEWGEREANVGHLPVLCLSSRSSPVGGHLPAPTCVTVTTSSHCSGLVARFNLKIVFDSRADFRFCSKWNPFILGIFDLRDVDADYREGLKNFQVYFNEEY